MRASLNARRDSTGREKGDLWRLRRARSFGPLLIEEERLPGRSPPAARIVIPNTGAGQRQVPPQREREILDRAKFTNPSLPYPPPGVFFAGVSPNFGRSVFEFSRCDSTSVLGSCSSKKWFPNGQDVTPRPSLVVSKPTFATKSSFQKKGCFSRSARFTNFAPLQAQE